MPVYRIHRLKESQRKQFRWAPHTSGATSVKPADYIEEGLTEAATPYAAWFHLKEGKRPLEVGDLLENLDGELCICKYVGFEQARWAVPEAVTAQETALAAGQPGGH